MPDTKHTISSFSSEMPMLTDTYRAISPGLFNTNENVMIPQLYRKMVSATVKGHKIKSGQYVLARSVSPLSGPSSVKTYFYDPTLGPAKILYFFIHAIQVGSSYMDHSFAFVSWPMHHPLHSSIGQP